MSEGLSRDLAKYWWLQISQQQFQNIEDHSAFIEQGGCQEVIEFVADWIEGQTTS